MLPKKIEEEKIKYYNRNRVKNGIEILKDKILKSISTDGDCIIFITDDNKEYEMFHDQDCCEQVYIEDICGDLNDLVGTPILTAEERTSRENPKRKDEDSFMWTFYELATIKGSVTIRWYGSSNGYYSERANLYEVVEAKNE